MYSLHILTAYTTAGILVNTILVKQHLFFNTLHGTRPLDSRHQFLVIHIVCSTIA